MSTSHHRGPFDDSCQHPKVRGCSISKPAVPTQRKTVAAACEACREPKIKCDGIRPQCCSCMRTKRACQCTTVASKTRLSALKRLKAHAEQHLRDINRSHWVLLQLVRAITTSADIDIAFIVQQLRQGCDPALILRRIEDGRLMLQLGQPDGATKQAAAGFAQRDLAEQQRTNKLAPIPTDQKSYIPLFRPLKSTEQEKGVEVLNRLHHGQDIWDILRFVDD